MRRGEPKKDGHAEGLGRVLDAAGEIVDTQGRPWTPKGLLGRGSWGLTYAVESRDGTAGVLKIPLDAGALDDTDDPRALAEACAAAARALKGDLESGRWPFLPKLLGAVELRDGTVGLITPRFDASLEARLAAGLPLVDAVSIVVRALQRLAGAAVGGVVHGNLRPSNVFLDEAGEPVLTDPLVEPLAAVHRTLERATGRGSYLPPEPGRGRIDGGYDTWALCLALYRASVLPGGADDGATRKLDLPREGLGRVQLATSKDAAAARLKAEHANKRFASRAVTKLGAVFNRGLSPEFDPSPPYRFRTAGELLERMVEIADLLHPAVDAVSRLMLGPSARDTVFEGVDSVVFSVNVATTAGVNAKEDVAVGVQVTDRDAPGDGRVRVPNARFSIEPYPSGKLRYEFVLPDVPPGRYHARLLFWVHDSGDDPKVAEGDFEVRPRPGYVPPERPDDGVPAPIPLPQLGAPSAVRRPPELDATARRPVDADDDDDDFDAPPPGAVVELAALRRAAARPVRPSEEPPSVVDEVAPSWSTPAPVTGIPRALPPATPARPGYEPPRTAHEPPARSSYEPPVGRASSDAADLSDAGWVPPRPTSPVVPPVWLQPPPMRVEVPAAPERAAYPSAHAGGYADPPSLATHPGVGAAIDDELDQLDPMLSDYPPPTHPGTAHTFTDLPAYDDDAPAGAPSLVDRLREQFLSWIKTDPLQAFFILAVVAFVTFAALYTALMRL